MDRNISVLSTISQMQEDKWCIITSLRWNHAECDGSNPRLGVVGEGEWLSRVIGVC